MEEMFSFFINRVKIDKETVKKAIRPAKYRFPHRNL